MGLFGEGQYNLNNMKEISVTDSFLGLDRDDRNCQNIETYDSCKTRLYIEKLREKCECLPLSIRLSGKVNKITHTVLAFQLWILTLIISSVYPSVQKCFAVSDCIDSNTCISLQ